MNNEFYSSSLASHFFFSDRLVRRKLKFALSPSIPHLSLLYKYSTREKEKKRRKERREKKTESGNQCQVIRIGKNNPINCLFSLRNDIEHK